jgi:hypothetical protein
MDCIKTKRGKSDKTDQDLKSVISRLDPEKMKFLPTSMIEKFKLILACYQRIVHKKENPSTKTIGNTNLSTKSLNLPNILKDDKTIY